MIYTRFGTEIKLVNPVNWDTGWVEVLRDGEPREYHLSELKADGGIQEIQAASDALENVHLCRDCKQPMETVQQGQWTVVTCKNHSCTLWSVTLTTDQYAKLTETEWQAYRESVVRLKKTLRVE